MADTLTPEQITTARAVNLTTLITPYELDPDDVVSIDTAADLDVVDADSYARGWELHNGLTALEKGIEAFFKRIKKPVQLVVNTVNQMQSEVLTPVKDAKVALGKKLTTWKVEQDARDAQAALDAQANADADERARQEARIATIERVAEAEPHPAMKASLQSEAVALRQAPQTAAPVTKTSSVPKTRGHFRDNWTCQVFNLPSLLHAMATGRVNLSEEDVIEALKPLLDREASSLKAQMAAAYPGCRAVNVPVPVSRTR